ncbi:MAG: ABC transporter ATP-binding protein [bacterium]|nr:MAG: ABC transporter ATP-binding protein [bacterium]
MTAYLEARDVTKRFGTMHALKGVSLDVARGGSLVLLGPNGAGKSTFLGILAGRIRPTGGTVSFEGALLRRSVEARRQTGYLSHSPFLYRGLTARENLMLYADLYSVQRSGARVDDLLRLMDLWERRHDRVGGFSRGMEQRLAIARSLLHDPGLLLLDEPFSGLDYRSNSVLMEILIDLRGRDRTMIISTHNLEVASSLGNDVAIIDRGVIRYRGAVVEDLRDLYMGLVGGGQR